MRPISALKIGDIELKSRLIVGTGKYASFAQMRLALEASGAQMVTVAVRRVNLDRTRESLLDAIDPKKYILLPNTAGCYTKEEADNIVDILRTIGAKSVDAIQMKTGQVQP